MVKSNKLKTVQLRLSINLSLDDVGLLRLYQELEAIENGAKDATATEVHALKRRHLLKILHDYSAGQTSPSSILPAAFKNPDMVAASITPALQEVVDQQSLRPTTTTYSSDTTLATPRKPSPGGLTTDQNLLDSLGIAF